MTESRVLITGGFTGIGLATAEAFRARGARVAATSFELPNDPGIPMDLRDEASIRAGYEQFVHDFGGIDVLVNCAGRTGMSAVSPFLDATTAHIDDVLDTNLRGVILLSQLAARTMAASAQGGSIIHVSSVGAIAAQEHASIYCATKAALVMLAKAMALELAPHNIRVNCVSPGDIDTKQAGATGNYSRKTPLGRRGQPHEIAAAIVWLASSDASFITGANLVADGGFLTY